MNVNAEVEDLGLRWLFDDEGAKAVYLYALERFR